MKTYYRATLILVLFAALSGCIPTDVYPRLESLETRVAAVEGVLTPSRTPPAPSPSPTMPAATSTPSATATRVATASRTSSPSLTPTATPTGTPTPSAPSAARLSVNAPATFLPASTISIVLEWRGPTAKIVMTLPREKIGYWDAPGDCGATCWTASDGWTHVVQVWMFSTWRAGETATFTVSAMADDEILASWICVLVCGSGTVQPTATPRPSATPTLTVLPATLRLEPRSWTRLENPSGAETVWLYVCNFPVGAPGGQLWTFTEDGTPLDWQIAAGHTWARLEAGGGNVLLWVDTAAVLEICDVRWYGRGQTWNPNCAPAWWGPAQNGYPVCE